VTEQAETLIPQLTTAIQGEHKVTPKEAEQVLQFLKLTQSTGKLSDLMNDQAVKLSQLHDMLKEVSKEVNHQVTESKTSESSSTAKISMQGFQQVVEQTVKNTETNEDSSTLGSATNTTTTVTTKTVSITLPAEKPAQSEALLKEIQNLINRSQMSNTQGSMRLLVKLYPENLGSIRIEIMQHDGVLTARLLTSTSLGKEMLDSQLQQLKTAFAQQNIQMDRIEVMQTLQETDRNMRDQNLFGNAYKQQQADQEDDDELEDSEDEDKISFSEYLINEEV
jgi:flagellar hook-length control protein FliK